MIPFAEDIAFSDSSDSEKERNDKCQAVSDLMLSIMQSLPELTSFSRSQYDSLLSDVDRLSRASGDLAVDVYSKSRSEVRDKIRALDCEIQEKCDYLKRYIPMRVFLDLPSNEEVSSSRIGTEIYLMKEILVRERRLREAEERYEIFLQRKKEWTTEE